MAVSTDDRAPHSPFSRVVTAWFWLVLGLVAVAAWTACRAGSLAGDWQGWRQADTAAIARHFTEAGAGILRPRIDWGGSGPGYVESEFQLYPYVVSFGLRLFGEHAWPGQLVSLAATLAAVVVVWRSFRARFGLLPAVGGALTLLTARAVVFAATSVQPEALCLLFYLVAWSAFERWVTDGGRKSLALYAVFGACAMLVKPTAAQLGVASFVWLLLGRRDKLRRAELWLAWAGMVAVLVAHLWHAHDLFETYGNTFGVLSGGDSKMPKLEHLLTPRLWLRAAKNALVWGAGPLGTLAFFVLAVRRRFDALLVALVVAAAVWTLLALRYTSQTAGTHYHLLLCFAAARAVALALSDALASGRVRESTLALASGSALAVVLVLTLRQRAEHRGPYEPSILAAGALLGGRARPGELVVVASLEPAWDAYWRTPNNFQDPRVFYLSRTHGWALAADDLTTRTLERAAREGARYYVEPEPRAEPAIDAWLSAHARLLERTSYGGRLFALNGATQSDHAGAPSDDERTRTR
jgi:4-amino-4-deoxy-L-arabinose transferase-like glycosyltransferase